MTNFKTLSVVFAVLAIIFISFYRLSGSVSKVSYIIANYCSDDNSGRWRGSANDNCIGRSSI